MPAITLTATADSSMTVILTGSTGSLGSYLLDSLVLQQHVGKIYCLNRAEDGGRSKQKTASGDRGLDTAGWGERVEFLHVDLSQPRFGLSSQKYAQLLRETTHIIHNQWPVNFNWDLSSFEPSIRGVRHLLDFCADSPRSVDFLFVSTIGTVSHVPSEPVAETPNHDLSPKLGGYSASKLICELIIEEHVKSSAGQQRAAICRVGQIAGPVRRNPDSGVWNRQEWLPSVIASSKHIGILPSSLGSMDLVNWVPVDLLSEIILELSGVVQVEEPEANKKSSARDGVAIYHAVNPHAVRWAALVPTVAGVIGLKPGDAVPWNQWVDALKLSGQESADPEKNPGLKLVDFYESLGGGRKQKGGGEMAMMPVLATEVTAAKSKTLASLHPVGTEWLALWVRQMGF